MEIPVFENKKDLFAYLVTNKDKLIATKKATIKHGAAVPFATGGQTPAMATKSIGSITEAPDEVRVLAVINTTNLLDSHGDVHLPGLWKKSLQENRYIMHIQEHEMKFDHIIAEGEDLKAYTKKYKWSDLGFDFEGETEALIFDSLVKRSNNQLMFERYKNKKVKNHSVGMQYMKLMLAINSDDYPTEKEIWDKYYPAIANKAAADDAGFFWAIKEAKALEGSAVPLGSNFATPTLEPDNTTPKTTEPPAGTQKIDLIKLSKILNS